MDARARFEAQREWFARYLRVVLEEAEPITEESVGVVELLLMEAEVDAANSALRQLGEPVFQPGSPHFVAQMGTTCMSTSLANGMISLGEPFLIEDPGRVHQLTTDVVARTSSFGKPGEYRSVDDLFKYLEADRLLDLEDGGARFAHNYRVRLCNSLLDVCEALWTGRGRLVIQRAAHAHLAYGLEREGDVTWVRFRDPMMRDGPGYTRVSLEALRRDYLWSPLKKIPRLMGPHAFPSLTAEELIGHLERYDTMENLGVDCPSALLFLESEAPSLHSPPEEADAEEDAAAEAK